jgi:hypothetical protein
VQAPEPASKNNYPVLIRHGLLDGDGALQVSDRHKLEWEYADDDRDPQPETQALIQRHLQSGQFHDIDELLTKALGALDEPPGRPTSEAKNLVDLFEPLRGLFADGELDFSRHPDKGRPVDLS